MNGADGKLSDIMGKPRGGKPSRSGQVNQLDGNIVATKDRISKLIPQTDPSKTDQQIEQNLERAKRANADNAKKVMEHQLNHQQPTNPISEIVDAAKTAKDVNDTGNRMIETLDYDRPG